MSTRPLGQHGEALAKQHLTQKGYKFLSQNFRASFGEIDLIFQDRDTIVFVEVKTRHRLAQGLPEEAVNPRKLRTITQVAQLYLHLNHLSDKLARIDVVAIETTINPPVIRHHINVTG